MFEALIHESASSDEFAPPRLTSGATQIQAQLKSTRLSNLPLKVGT
jgi:hypothetical protein